LFQFASKSIKGMHEVNFQKGFIEVLLFFEIEGLLWKIELR